MGSEDSTYRISSWLFLRIVGLIFFIAFVSLWTQVHGLIGASGITPVPELIERASARFGIERFWFLPTVFWISSSDWFLHVVCAVGALGSIAVILGFLSVPILFLLWLLYLSLVTVGDVFLRFQWDSLLLEVGFLSIFLAPLALRSKLSDAPDMPRIVRWAFWFLLFKLVFLSGVVKLASGDYAWRTLTALNVHYETQPLPTWIGWYAHQLPTWLQKLSTVNMFAIELILPFFIFAARKLRLAGCVAFVGLQFLILVTGNYCFFNTLTIALCLLLVDDSTWPRQFLRPPEPRLTMTRFAQVWKKWIAAPMVALILFASSMQILRTTGFPAGLIKPGLVFVQLMSSFRSVNSYGLFAVMTTSRLEIVIEGSNDGKEWRTYEFKWKPQDVKRRPRFVAPHQPRLDWQMWFAALGQYRSQPWFMKFVQRLLEGSPAVLGLLAENPFPDAPPRFIRAAAYDYHFTDFAEKKRDGAWWRRVRTGLFSPSMSLKRT